MSGPQEIDPVTGHVTTGHEWNGIKELNTPFPRIALWALIITVVYSVVAWVLLPAWPLGSTYTKGVLGVDQTTDAQARHAEFTARRVGWEGRFATADLDDLAGDADLLAVAQTEMTRLYADNCAACHGSTGAGKDGRGGPGFPALNDADWLWSGELEEIAEVIRTGINSDHEDTHLAQMAAFGRDDLLTRAEIDLLVPFVAGLHDGNADFTSPAGELYADNCASCHGDAGEGGLGVGAPALNDAGWIYGGSPAAIRRTLIHGRAGTMPAWEGRLTLAERNMLTLFVARLAAEDAP